MAQRKRGAEITASDESSVTLGLYLTDEQLQLLRAALVKHLPDFELSVLNSTPQPAAASLPLQDSEQLPAPVKRKSPEVKQANQAVAARAKQQKTAPAAQPQGPREGESSATKQDASASRKSGKKKEDAGEASTAVKDTKETAPAGTGPGARTIRQRLLSKEEIEELNAKVSALSRDELGEVVDYVRSAVVQEAPGEFSLNFNRLGIAQQEALRAFLDHHTPFPKCNDTRVQG